MRNTVMNERCSQPRSYNFEDPLSDGAKGSSPLQR